MNVGHGRNFKRMGWLLGNLCPGEACCVRIFDVECDGTVSTATVYQYSGSFSEISLVVCLNLVAVDSHLRFSQHSRETFPGSWKSWRSMAFEVKNIDWSSCEEALESDHLSAMDAKPVPRKVFGTKCKLAGDAAVGTIGRLQEANGEKIPTGNIAPYYPANNK